LISLLTLAISLKDRQRIGQLGVQPRFRQAFSPPLILSHLAKEARQGGNQRRGDDGILFKAGRKEIFGVIL